MAPTELAIRTEKDESVRNAQIGPLDRTLKLQPTVSRAQVIHFRSGQRHRDHLYQFHNIGYLTRFRQKKFVPGYFGRVSNLRYILS
jgi:hypothetical protein